ncbi:MAG TPA: septation protein IspZ [Hyphomicrobium sp.]|nr:septation protein IspZ [Hyphomicrobium sp.]
MSALKRLMPFNAEQTVNILSEFGPLVLMFIVNAMYGITAGTWALIISTVVAIFAMLVVLRRLPIFPLIASTVTMVFGALTIITGDAMWVQIKVTIFNLMFAGFLFGGLWLNRNFFKYVFEKTFHYTDEGWNRFTWSFAWFFVFTAIANEFVRLSFKDEQVYQFLGLQMDGVGIWIAFKVAIIMPLSGIYAWYLTRIMQRFRISEAEAQRMAAEAAVRERSVEVAEFGRAASSESAARAAGSPGDRKANLG